MRLEEKIQELENKIIQQTDIIRKSETIIKETQTIKKEFEENLKVEAKLKEQIEIIKTKRVVVNKKDITSLISLNVIYPVINNFESLLKK